jgi:hypothetical protein
MSLVNDYKHVLLDEFHLGTDGEIYRSKDGYLGRFKKGDKAKFFKNATGYWTFQIPGARRVLAKSILVYILHGFDIPEGMDIDHQDGNKDNNHISNLRLVTRQVNNRNRKKRSDNTSGVTGIRWSDYHNHYVIRRTIGNKRISRNRKTFEEALIVLQELKQMDDSYTERHGK